MNDDKLDQFEFVLGSLILLGKVGSGDIMNIMDKFRELAGPNGYIADIDASDSKDDDDDDVSARQSGAPEAPASDLEMTNNKDTAEQQQGEIPGSGDNSNIPVEPTTSTIIHEIPNNGRPNLLDIFKGPSAGTFRLGGGDGGDKEQDDPQYMDMDVPSSRF